MTYQDVKQQISMKQVLSFFGVKSKRGVYLCPFHNDKHPSAHILRNGQFKCYACDWQGDIFDFAKGMGMDSKTLAASFGIEFGGKVSQEEMARIRAERAEKERIEALKAYQMRKICAARRWFWFKYREQYDYCEDDIPPVAFLDSLSTRLPVSYDIDAMIKGLYNKYKEVVKDCN